MGICGGDCYMMERIKSAYLKGQKPVDFLLQLEEHGIEVVVDVRDWFAYPLYFYPAIFKNKENQAPTGMPITLGDKFEFLSFNELGNPKWIRSMKKGFSVIERDKLIKETYMNEIRTFKLDKLRELFEIIKKSDKVFGLICYCPTLNPAKCHRFWVKDLLNEIFTGKL
jgi:hypothetical protein